MSGRALAAATGILTRRLGMRVDAPARRRLTRVLRHGAQEAGLEIDDYVAALERDDAALHDLIDRITVQETSFFRHEAQLDAIAAELAARPGGGVVWSAGCASGQEPWSLAMSIVERGLHGWTVFATDVSQGALERARTGRYTERELRGLSEVRRRRFLRRAGQDAWEVAPELRELVRFARHNLVRQAPPAETDCRVVLWRNVLIYLPGGEAGDALGRLRARMPRDGVLVVGAAEALPPGQSAFRAERRGGVYVYRPRFDDAPPPASAAAPTRRGTPARPAPAGLPDAATTDLVAAGERAAADGRYGEAAQAFRRAAYLRPHDPMAHVRLGLVLEALGDGSAARRAFRAARLALQRADADALAAELGGWSAGELERLVEDRLAAG